MSNTNSSSPITNNQTVYIFIDGKIREVNKSVYPYTYSTNKITLTDWDNMQTYFSNCDTYYNYKGKENVFEFEYNENPTSSEFQNATLYIYVDNE